MCRCFRTESICSGQQGSYIQIRLPLSATQPRQPLAGTHFHTELSQTKICIHESIRVETFCSVAILHFWGTNWSSGVAMPRRGRVLKAPFVSLGVKLRTRTTRYVSKLESRWRCSAPHVRHFHDNPGIQRTSGGCELHGEPFFEPQVELPYGGPLWPSCGWVAWLNGSLWFAQIPSRNARGPHASPPPPTLGLTGFRSLGIQVWRGTPFA